MNPWRGLKNISHNVWLVALTTLVNRSGTMVIPFLIIYMTSQIGLSSGEAGFVIAVYGAGGLFTAPFVGRLSDRLGSLWVMKVSLFATGLIIILYSFVKNYYAILCITILWAVISEAFRPANLSFISDETEPEQRKTAFALNRLAVNLGMSIGPVIGGFLCAINFSLLFYVNGTMSILAGIFLIFARIHPQTVIRKKDPNHVNMSILKDKIFLLYLISIVPAGLVFFQFLGGFPLYVVRELKISTSTFGILMAINTVLIILIEVPLNNAMANWNDRKSVALGALLCGLGFGGMVISGNIWFIAFTIVVWTFGEMMFFPSSASYTSVLSPENQRGEYMGYYQMSFSFAMMVGPWLGALILDHYGHIILWSGAFLFAMVSTISILSLKRRVS